MPRIQFSDVTPPERRSIRDVPIPSSSRRHSPSVIKIEKVQTPPEPVVPEVSVPEKIEKERGGAYEYYYPQNPKGPGEKSAFPRKSRRKTFVFGTVIAVLIAIFVVSMMTVFASATIMINPKSQGVAVDTKIAGGIGKITDDTVRYEVIKLSESKTATVQAAGEEAAEVKASGKIVVYNNFSSEPQRLIVRTRFETPDGLVFRIPESIVVPGKTIKGGAETPGSVEVEVFADEAGEKYNIEKTDFTVPGFKNDANRYKNFYARSVTEMTGGFIGKRKTVLVADKEAALKSIEEETKVSLEKNLQAKVPEGLVLLSGAVAYKSKELPQEEAGSSVIIGREVTAYAVMLNEQDLSDAVTRKYIANSADWEGITPIVDDFSLLNVVDVPTNLETSEGIELQINGTAEVVSLIDTDLISQKLLGAPKGSVARLMDEFAGISSITATIRPVWKQSFPQNPSKIYVRIGK